MISRLCPTSQLPRTGPRFSLSVLIPFAGLLVVTAAVTAQNATTLAPKQKAEDSKQPQEKTLLTGDDWQIPITYYPSLQGQDSPIVILLPGRRGDRLVWDRGFAKRLQNDGYAVVTVDLRKHGKSQHRAGAAEGTGSKLKNIDFQMMVAEDMRAVKAFLLGEHQKKRLNIRKTGIVAPEMSAPVALSFAVEDWNAPPYDDATFVEERTPRGQDVRAIVMLSPEAKAAGLPMPRVLEQVRAPDWGIAFLTINGTTDSLDKGDSKLLYQKLTLPRNSKERTYLKSYQVGLRGPALLEADPDVQEQMLGFLKLHLKDLPDEWRDRQSPLTK